MFIEEFNVELPEGIELRISIWTAIVDGQEVYYAKYINTAILEEYDAQQRAGAYGIIYTEHTNGPVVYYTDRERFKTDLTEILKQEGGERLNSEI